MNAKQFHWLIAPLNHWPRNILHGLVGGPLMRNLAFSARLQCILCIHRSSLWARSTMITLSSHAYDHGDWWWSSNYWTSLLSLNTSSRALTSTINSSNISPHFKHFCTPTSINQATSHPLIQWYIVLTLTSRRTFLNTNEIVPCIRNEFASECTRKVYNIPLSKMKEPTK